MGYRLSSPINVMLCEAREYPLRLRFNLLSERFVIKCMSKRNHPVINSIESLEYSLSTPAQKAQALAKSPSLRCYITNKHDISHLKSSYFIPAFESSLNAFIFRKHFESFISCTKETNDNEIIQSFSNRLQELDSSGLTVYTDGSKLSEDGCAGAAFFSPELGHCFKYKLTCSASVFTAEAWAIHQALILALVAGYSKIYIFSDSRSVLQAISSHRLINGNYIIHKIKQVLLQLEHSNIDCFLFWIPSHKGILGNELADRAAKEACVDGARGFFRTPYSDLQIQAVAKARARFTDYLNDKANHTGAHYHSLYFSSTTAIPWYFKKKLNRNEIVLVNRLRSNHYNLNYSLFRKNMVLSPACECGDPRQDLNHSIFFCPLTRRRARPLVLYLNKAFPSHSYNIFTLLANPSHKLCRLLLAFPKSFDVPI
ncbi:PREDICTED: uncharacterized protein LOC108773860 [Cyphomyrmex costatus]|nr:PREDICTED: uncharacterized protein LOC108773860 [Cyphomyrmex costatus]